MKTAILAFLLLVAATPISSQDERRRQDTGDNLLEQCGALVNFSDTSRLVDSSKVDWCIGYLKGTIQTYDAIRFYMSMGSISSYKEHGPYQVCMPGEISLDQMARVIVKYLRAHPENLHWQEGQLTMLALLEAFPCKNLQPVPTEVRP